MQIWRDKDKATAKAIAPDPSESRAEFMERCLDETGDEDACALAWDERAAKDVLHRTHVSAGHGLEFILSDATPDRMGDVIEADGWDLTNFRKNPVALFNHRADFPIGKWSDLRSENGALRGHLQLAPDGTSPRIDEIRRLVDADIVKNVIGDKLSDCFEQARITGATLDEFDRIRQALVAEDVLSLVAVLVKQACVSFCLQQMSMAIVAIDFTSREDVDSVRGNMNAAFDQSEEIAADEMAQAAYQALMSLHAAVTFHLYETARPLPQMLQFIFAAPRPTLVQSYRLYDTAARADELREENKVVHPAFAPREGRALAF
jgi:hypothetical protein